MKIELFAGCGDDVVFEFDYCEPGNSIRILTKAGHTVLDLDNVPPGRFKQLSEAFATEIARGAKKTPFDKRQPTPVG